MLEDQLPIHIMSTRALDHRALGIDAITAQGRRITAVVPFWNTTPEGVHQALLESAASQLEADAVLLAVQESWAADERDEDALDDTDIDATTG